MRERWICLRGDSSTPGDCLSHNMIFGQRYFTRIEIMFAYVTEILIRRECDCTICACGTDKAWKVIFFIFLGSWCPNQTESLSKPTYSSLLLPVREEEQNHCGRVTQGIKRSWDSELWLVVKVHYLTTTAAIGKTVCKSATWFSLHSLTRRRRCADNRWRSMALNFAVKRIHDPG